MLYKYYPKLFFYLIIPVRGRRCSDCQGFTISDQCESSLIGLPTLNDMSEMLSMPYRYYDACSTDYVPIITYTLNSYYLYTGIMIPNASDRRCNNVRKIQWLFQSNYVIFKIFPVIYLVYLSSHDTKIT